MGVFTVGRQVALEIDMPGWWLANASVDMDFRRGFYYDSSTANPRAAIDFLSCSRASIGYAKNADGTLTQFANDTLRIGVGTGLLVEDSRTNISAKSQDLTDTGVWNTNVAVTINGDVTTAPDGTSTADSIIPTSANSTHSIAGFGGVAGGVFGTVTASIYLKANGYNFAYLGIQYNGGAAVWVAMIDLTNGSIVNTTNEGTSPTNTAQVSETLANGWYRLSVTMDNPSTNVSVKVGVASTNTFGSYVGNTTSGIYAWAAQAESGSFASSYIPTNVSAATRAADNITISGSLQTVINAATASLLAQTDNGAVSSVAANIIDSNGTNLLGFDATNHALASITAMLATGNTANRTTQDKLGLAWSGAGRSLVLNNGTVATDASAQTPSATQHIGSSGTDKFAFAYIERLTAWTTKLADATLQALTAP